MRVEIPFVGASEEEESSFVNPEQCVNLYPRPYLEAGRQKVMLVGTPGLENWVDLGTDEAVRGSIAYANYLYVVSGNQFFQVGTGGTATEKGAGTIETAAGRVSMSTNGLDVTFVDGTNGYVYDISAGTLTKITDADFPSNAKTIAFVDGYYFVNASGSNQMHQSTINDGTSWPGYIESAGSRPDYISGLIADHDELWPICDRSAEVWYNAVNAGFVLSVRQGAFYEQGCVAPFSIAKGNNAIYWLGRDDAGQGQVFHVAGMQIGVVSTLPLQFMISQYTTMTDAFALTYQEEGHAFYVLTFPAADATWVYDATVRLWHRRSSRITYGPGRVRDGRWRVNTHSLFNEMHIVGDFENGKLYKLKNDVYDDDGEELIATRVSPLFRSNQNLITANSLQILVDPGVGLVSGQGSDPKIILDWSWDGGKTYGNEIELPIGKIGEYANRAITPPLGQGRNPVFRMKISDPVRRQILGAFADVEVDAD